MMCLELTKTKHFDFEEMIFLLSVYTVFVALLWFWFRLPLPVCPFHVLTGYPCLTCGATRVLKFLLQGEMVSAFLMNPLFFMFLCGLLLFNVYAAVVVCFRCPRLRIKAIGKGGALLIRVSVAVLLMLNWGYLIFF